MIISIQYIDETNETVRVELDDGMVWFCPQPCETWHNELIQEWLDAGNEIAPYE